MPDDLKGPGEGDSSPETSVNAPADAVIDKFVRPALEPDGSYMDALEAIGSIMEKTGATSDAAAAALIRADNDGRLFITDDLKLMARRPDGLPPPEVVE